MIILDTIKALANGKNAGVNGGRIRMCVYKNFDPIGLRLNMSQMVADDRWGPYTAVILKSEDEIWPALISHDPAYASLGEEADMIGRILMERYRLLATAPGQLEHAREQAFETIEYFYRVLLDHLGARDAMKSKLMIKPTSASRTLSAWFLSRKIHLPYESAPVRMYLSCMPSPHEEKTWSISVRIACTKATGTVQAQQAIERALQHLTNEGYTFKDVLAGTYCF